MFSEVFRQDFRLNLYLVSCLLTWNVVCKVMVCLGSSQIFFLIIDECVASPTPCWGNWEYYKSTPFVADIFTDFFLMIIYYNLLFYFGWNLSALLFWQYKVSKEKSKVRFLPVSVLSTSSNHFQFRSSDTKREQLILTETWHKVL